MYLIQFLELPLYEASGTYHTSDNHKRYHCDFYRPRPNVFKANYRSNRDQKFLGNHFNGLCTMNLIRVGHKSGTFPLLFLPIYLSLARLSKCIWNRASISLADFLSNNSTMSLSALYDHPYFKAFTTCCPICRIKYRQYFLNQNSCRMPLRTSVSGVSVE